MLACGFSKAEANDRAQRMAIYRHLKKVGQPKQDDTNEYVTPPTLAVDVPVLNKSALSSVTVSLSDVIVPGEDDDPILHGPPKRVRLAASQKQNVLNERKKKERVYNRAFKRATICYAREKGKTGGKSAREVCEMARREFSVDLSARTIQDAVSKGRIGVLPLQRGPKGSIPDVHYKNLCLAFESFLAINQDNGDVRVRSRKKLGKILQITQPRTKERQELLSRAKNAGQRHMATGGCHLTHDDMLISIEMASRSKDAGEIEKEKKLRLGLQAAEESARAILALGKLVEDLKGADLDVLLKWHQVKMEKGAKVPDKRRVWKEIFEEGRSPPSYEKWTEEDEERLMATTKSNLSLADTRFGRTVATRKRELEASVDFMSREERERMIRKLHELNEEEAPATSTGMEEEHTGVLGQMDGV
jgi:hypothetical protein